MLEKLIASRNANTGVFNLRQVRKQFLDFKFFVEFCQLESQCSEFPFFTLGSKFIVQRMSHITKQKVPLTTAQ